MSYKWNLNARVWVGELGPVISQKDIEEAFGKFGPLKKIWIAPSRVYALVEFESPQDASKAIEALRGTKLCGQFIWVKSSHGSGKTPAFLTNDFLNELRNSLSNQK